MPIVDDTPTTDEGSPEAPTNSIATVAAGRKVYERMRTGHAKRVFTYARIQGMLDGNPPYAKETLRRKGMQTMSNINWRDGEAIYESVALAYWSLFNEVERIVEATTDMASPSDNALIGQVVSEEYDRLIRKWTMFDSLMNQHQGDLVKFGPSFFIWPDERDWRFDVSDIWRTLVPEKTRNHTELLSLVAVEHVMSAQELWEIYESDARHWDKETLGNLLVQLAGISDKEQYSGQEILKVQTMIRNGDLCMDEIYSDDILLVSLYIKETDGKVSRGMFCPRIPEGENWLFFFDRQYDSMRQAVQLFSYTPGERYIHGNKGIGHRIFNTIEGISQIDNSVMDGVRRSGTVLVRSRAGRNKELKQFQFVHGGFVDIGEAEFVQNLMGANLTPSVEVARYFRYKLETNNNIAGAFMNAPDGKTRTFGEVRVQATREAKVQKHRIAHYYLQLDCLLQEVFRKILKSKEGYPGYQQVKIFKKRCIARGVPEEFFELSEDNEGENGLPDHMEIHAVRASGSGSQVADQVETDRMMQVLPTLGERGRKAVMRDFVAANRGYRYIDRYLPQEDQTEQPTSEDTLASIENNQLEKGEMVVVSPDNVHAIHAPRHLGRMEQLAKAFMEEEKAAREAGSKNAELDAAQFGQYSLEEVDIAFQTIGPHFIRHLLYMQQDSTRQALAKSLVSRWAIIANYADKIANNAQEARTKQLRDMQARQQEMEGISEDEKVAMAKIASDERVKMQKLILETQRGATRDQMQHLLERQRVSFEEELKAAKARAEIARVAAKTAAEEVSGKNQTEVY